ncbi:MAG: hypothetical protein NTW08_06395 [Gammaproteobacteria bacterium]|nr:hypothetical protein [Gammaproteobacteria bacterium]
MPANLDKLKQDVTTPAGIQRWCEAFYEANPLERDVIYKEMIEINANPLRQALLYKAIELEELRLIAMYMDRIPNPQGEMLACLVALEYETDEAKEVLRKVFLHQDEVVRGIIDQLTVLVTSVGSVFPSHAPARPLNERDDDIEMTPFFYPNAATLPLGNQDTALILPHPNPNASVTVQPQHNSSVRVEPGRQLKRHQSIDSRSPWALNAMSPAAQLQAGIHIPEQCKDKTQFLRHLRIQLEKTGITCDMLLNFFTELKQPTGQYSYIHQQKHPIRDRILVFFKSRKNENEVNFWHTETYQKAVKLLKAAYIKTKHAGSLPSKLSDEDLLIDYVRGNSITHFKQTSTRDLMPKSPEVRTVRSQLEL